MFAIIDKLIPPVIVIHIFLFLILFLVLKKFLFLPILKHIDERGEEINKAIKTFNEEKMSLEKKMAEYRDEISAVKNKALSEVQKYVKEALTKKTAIISEAHSQAFQILQESRIEIDLMKKKLLSVVEEDIKHISEIIKEKIISG